MKKIFLILVNFYLCFQLSIQNHQVKAQTVTEIEGISTKQSFSIGKYANGIPMLATTQKFVEPSGNKLLDGGEDAYIEITITNNGEGSAFEVKAAMTADNSTNITFDKTSEVISELKSGVSKTIKMDISGNENLLDGSKKFSITFDESGGFKAAPCNFTVNTQKMKSPQLAFIEAGIEEIQGDKNNIISQNELIRVAVLIQNTGQGDATGVESKIVITDASIVPVLKTYTLSQSIGTLTSGSSKTVYFDFSVTWNYAGSDILPISITLSEAKGKFGGTFPLNLSLNKQTLAATDIKVDGTYSTDTEIKDVSLGIDVDKNIPKIGKINTNRFALIIGNENYVKNKGLQADVTFALRDAQVFKEYAINTLGIPDKTNIIYLEDATATEMEEEIDNFLKLMEISPEKREFFVYYAGHGYPDENKDAYLMPVDVKADYIKNAIKLSDFYTRLIEKNPKQVTVFLDACFSGGGRTGLDLVTARSGVRINPNSTTVSGNLVIFAATSEDEISKPYDEKQHGMFSYFLFKALQDYGGKLTYGQLADELVEKIGTYSITINKEQQTPKVNVSAKLIDTWENLNMND